MLQAEQDITGCYFMAENGDWTAKDCLQHFHAGFVCQKQPRGKANIMDSYTVYNSCIIYVYKDDQYVIANHKIKIIEIK